MKRTFGIGEEGGQKRCSGLCGQMLPRSRFYSNTTAPDGRQSDCKWCQKKRHDHVVIYDGLKKQVDLGRMSRVEAVEKMRSVPGG